MIRFKAAVRSGRPPSESHVVFNEWDNLGGQVKLGSYCEEIDIAEIKYLGASRWSADAQYCKVVKVSQRAVAVL